MMLKEVLLAVSLVLCFYRGLSSCVWIVAFAQGYGVGHTGYENKENCGIFCRKEFKNMGAFWSGVTSKCYCILHGKPSTPTTDREIIMFCGITLKDKQITVGAISEVKIIKDLKQKPENTRIEIFGVDDLDDRQISDRFLIKQPETLLGGTPIVALGRSNFTKQYNSFLLKKDPTSERTAEGHIIHYKIGDLGLLDFLWVTLVMSDSQNIRVKLQRVLVHAPSPKESNLLVHTDITLTRNDFCLLWKLNTSTNSNSDIIDIKLTIQSQRGMKLHSVNVQEHSMEITNMPTGDLFQTFELEILSLDAFISYNITYKINTQKMFTGHIPTIVVASLQYKHFVNNELETKFRNESFLELFTNHPYSGLPYFRVTKIILQNKTSLSVIINLELLGIEKTPQDIDIKEPVQRPSEKFVSPVDCTAMEIESQLVVCYTRRVKRCFAYASGVVRILPQIRNILGFDLITGEILGTDKNVKKLSINSYHESFFSNQNNLNQQKSTFRHARMISWRNATNTEFEIDGFTYNVTQQGLYNVATRKYVLVIL